MERIYSELFNISYSKNFIDRVKTRITNPAPLERNWTSTVCIHYVPKISEAIRRTLNPEGIRVAFTSTSTLEKSLTHVKDSIPKDKASQLVYKLSCQDCTTVYIGETSRSVADRMKEHSQLTKRNPRNNEERTKLDRSSAIALHVLETEHHVDFDNPEILPKYWPIYRDRINAEQCFIIHPPEACNLKGKTTHPAWNLI